MKPDTLPAEQSLLRAVNGAAPISPPLDFHTIYERWFDDVFRWIRTMGAPAPDREDLVQDVFIIVHRRLPFFDGKNMGGWLFKIALHRVRDFRRLRWMRDTIFLGNLALSEKFCSTGASPAETFETKEKHALLERLLGRLNDMERATFVLFEIDGYSGEAIAELQGIPVNTVWARIHRARKKLKAALAEQEGDAAAPATLAALGSGTERVVLR